MGGVWRIVSRDICGEVVIGAVAEGWRHRGVAIQRPVGRFLSALLRLQDSRGTLCTQFAAISSTIFFGKVRPDLHLLQSFAPHVPKRAVYAHGSLAEPAAAAVIPLASRHFALSATMASTRFSNGPSSSTGSLETGEAFKEDLRAAVPAAGGSAKETLRFGWVETVPL